MFETFHYLSKLISTVLAFNCENTVYRALPRIHENYIFLAVFHFKNSYNDLAISGPALANLGP